MARGPDGTGGGAGFSLRDQLFNVDTLSDLAAEYARLPGFDSDLFLTTALQGLEPLGLMARLDHIADAIQDQLPQDFSAMAECLVAAMPAPLDPSLTDNDFGRFIHAVPGILAVRHGLERPDQALNLLHSATQRFSMEFYIRPFLDRWPDDVLERLADWAEDDNYHVRRLVSEGTRPRLPWGKALRLDPMRAVSLLDQLHADPTRYVTRSVANHLNDLTRKNCAVVVDRVTIWRGAGRQCAKELDWMTRHALRGAIKRGETGALTVLGYDPDADLTAGLHISNPTVVMGDALMFELSLIAPVAANVLVDYRIGFAGGRTKVFKFATLELKAGVPTTINKRHKLKAEASTFKLFPGAHRLIIQVNGIDRAEGSFDVLGQTI